MPPFKNAVLIIVTAPELLLRMEVIAG